MKWANILKKKNHMQTAKAQPNTRTVNALLWNYIFAKLKERKKIGDRGKERWRKAIVVIYLELFNKMHEICSLYMNKIFLTVQLAMANFAKKKIPVPNGFTSEPVKLDINLEPVRDKWHIQWPHVNKIIALTSPESTRL